MSEFSDLSQKAKFIDVPAGWYTRPIGCQKSEYKEKVQRWQHESININEMIGMLHI